MGKYQLRVLGVMTGTSCDGIDAACLEFDHTGWETLWTASAPYPKALRESVLEFQKPDSKFLIKDWLALHCLLGEWYGKTLRKFIKNHDHVPDVIANHGQTVAHYPDKNRKGMTFQLGEGSRICVETGLTVISNFRDGDMAAGGQGAPLVPLFHKIIAHHIGRDREGVAIHNLGGISNFTYIKSDGGMIAFDTGPGNIWIDASVEKISKGKLHFDAGGKMGAAGVPHPTVVKKLLRHAYLAQKPPKSTGRDDFSSKEFSSLTKGLSGNDLVATATEATVQSISQAYKKWVIGKGFPLKTIYLCGGGSKNLGIIAGLQRDLPGTKITTLQDRGMDPQYIEAQAFGMFGFLTLMGHPLGGAWTGVHEFGPPGHIIPGQNWQNVMKKLSGLT